VSRRRRASPRSGESSGSTSSVDLFTSTPRGLNGTTGDQSTSQLLANSRTGRAPAEPVRLRSLGCDRYPAALLGWRHRTGSCAAAAGAEQRSS
jgi:hypothetical protein